MKFKNLKRNIKRIGSTILQFSKGNYKGLLCPFCETSSLTMKPIGRDLPSIREKNIIGAGRRFAGCPHCGSTDRERLVLLYLKHELDLFNHPQDQRILHVAPEKNLSLKLLKGNFYKYICGDKFAEGYKYPEYVKNIDITKIPFADGTFNLIICNHVLEHVSSDLEALNELRRVLCDNGVIVLQVPISKTMQVTLEDQSVTGPHEREKIFGQHDHVRLYGQDYPERLKKSGFEVKKLSLYKRFKKYGLNPEEELFICKK